MKKEESMHEYFERKEKEYAAHYEEKVVNDEREEKQSKIDKLVINVEKVITTLQIGFLLTTTCTGVYAISKAKTNGERVLPNTIVEEMDSFKYDKENNELVIPTVHGNTARIKIK